MRRLWIALAPALLCACSPRVVAVRAVVPVLTRGAEAFYEEPDPQLAREAMASQLKLLEGLLKNDPGNAELSLLCAEGFGGYAFLFLEDSEPARARGIYRRGRDHALAALADREHFRDLESMPLDRVEAALKLATPVDARALFWAGYGWGGWINLSKDNPEAVAGLPKAAAVMRRVRELSPGFYFGGADLFLGAYFAARPKILGGDPEKAKAFFDSAVAATGGRFLTAKVLYAQYYAVAAQDRELFKALNEEVLASSDDFPQARLANAVAKLKAKRLLEKTDELF